ncbi:transposase IS116/IS110/IS902 family protein [Clostridium pasteurianum DSM 525 = ATCC 6013]|uniref:Transposase IS116/IS110/IS902 family protein n=1 Tax=Clostridium pasteurianum DSM 525 = ATCC 6013 TaxID=1262449 RepID=A0A0H3J0K2_CLOPA|nr:IS110 family transposase [Clostridium pasteurianum]AJA46874.1 transposase IS116/IS110/IS902 family protein [Clostridium pasteurianum DSM 525 = ATCC 6013]AJA46919.1 transposase IS116/IS110/IS902 family protein [Clostridium pasteurianum DSM 525 = ATCC 6013]AJA47055.1 transposase IS116/IS110/IS902 family protein [Clostridium pasteurianum DSM 525 = ATCC 6013]AJA47305.1 transposase IS116/IS110/IS902 family protein [Clostridium pasteurianum DSM 525 = ATCC 6013]AJA48466.1 transposase IS116/IS110/I
MSKFFYRPIVGIDVSADFSVVAILAPDGEVYRKPFKIKHNRNGFDYLVDQIKKAEEEFNMKTAIFMESTGVYHLTLFHFLRDTFETCILNPLITNCNKNGDIRKVKNDKKDALTIAKIGKFQNVKYTSAFDIEIYTLKALCRDYYKFTDSKSTFKKKLSTDLKIIFPSYSSVFSNITCKTSIAILKEYSSPKAILNADKNELIDLIRSHSRKGLTYSEKIYKKLIDAAEEAIYIGLKSPSLFVKIMNTISVIETLENQLNNLLNEIHSLMKSNRISEQFKKNVQLIYSIPGIGELTAITIMSEIGNIKGFVKAKHLVAYFGIDPSVNQSGKFNSNKNTMSKRGTRIGRRALYAVALASIRTSRSGEPINKVLLTYYKENLNGKSKKVALVAIMHKLVNYIFSVLRNQKEYEIRDPKIHIKMYLNNGSTTAA